jgi:membrane-bound metal-dependent hydrolase YbcI (DUF457 family)
MDTITHGIAGALIARAFFAERAQAAPAGQSRAARGITIASAALGGMFPDSDSLRGLADSSGLSVITTHRAETHSLLCLPAWALGLAWLTRALCRAAGWKPPSLLRLWAVYAAAIASHIFLDLITSFGTMVWAPANYSRFAWDLAFILDFTLTAIVLLPQVAAWVGSRRAGSMARAAATWALFTLAALGVRWLAVSNAVEFSLAAAGVASAALATLFALAAWSAGRAGCAAWCRGGLAVLLLYLGGCWLANHAAVERVEAVRSRQGFAAVRAAAIPLPPWPMRWLGVALSPEGVYSATLSLLDSEPPEFRFMPNSRENEFTQRARRLPEVKAYFEFARFPTLQYFDSGGAHIVELRDWRFGGRPGGGRMPFTYRIEMDAEGRVLQSGWAD